MALIQPIENEPDPNSVNEKEKERGKILSYLQNLMFKAHLPPQNSGKGQPFERRLAPLRNGTNSPQKIKDSEGDKGDGPSSSKLYEKSFWRKHLGGFEPIYRLRTLIYLKHIYSKNEASNLLGPGSYNPSFCVCRGQGRGVMSSCSPRFLPESEPDSIPSPRRYFGAQDTLDKYYEGLKHPGKVSLFKSGPCLSTRPFQIISEGPGPGIYNVKSTFDAHLCSKISKRVSPAFYPNESQPRVEHYKFYDIGGELGSCESFKGKFGVSSRNSPQSGERITISSTLWPRKNAAELPGPGKYNIDAGINEKSQSKKSKAPPFGRSSLARAKEMIDDGVDISPDKYMIQSKITGLGNGHRSAFKPSGARLDLKKMGFLQERLRQSTKDLPPGELMQISC